MNVCATGMKQGRERENIRERARMYGGIERKRERGRWERRGSGRYRKRNCVEERQEREKDKERDNRTRGTDVFETSCAALAMPSLNLYPHPLHSLRPSLLSPSRSFRAYYRASRNPR